MLQDAAQTQLSTKVAFCTELDIGAASPVPEALRVGWKWPAGISASLNR